MNFEYRVQISQWTHTVPNNEFMHTLYRTMNTYFSKSWLDQITKDPMNNEIKTILPTIECILNAKRIRAFSNNTYIFHQILKWLDQITKGPLNNEINSKSTILNAKRMRALPTIECIIDLWMNECYVHQGLIAELEFNDDGKIQQWLLCSFVVRKLLESSFLYHASSMLFRKKSEGLFYWILNMVYESNIRYY